MPNLNTTGTKSVRRSARTKLGRKPTNSLSITDIAHAMAEADKLAKTLHNGRAIAEAIIAGVVKDECAAQRRPGHDVERIQSECSTQHDLMDERHTALAGALFHLDPSTPSEVLSLALVLGSELDTLIANFTDHRSCAKARRAGDAVERAYHAVVLGLIRHVGLSSPILDRYLSPRTRVASIEQATATAEKADRFMKMKPR